MAINKITEGITGQQAANIINGNDEKLDINIYNTAAAAGLNVLPAGSNILAYLNPLDTADRSEWATGYYRVDGTVFNAGWVNKLIPINAGTYRTNNYIAGEAAYVFFDRDMNVVQTWTARGNVSGSIEWNFTIPDSGFLGISQGTIASTFRDPFYITALAETIETTGRVFVLQSEFAAKTEEAQKQVMEDVYGIEPTPEGVNFAQHLAESSLSNLFLWARGFLKNDGTIQNDGNWYHTLQYLFLKKGRYEGYFWFSGNARAIIYNLDHSIRRTIAGGGSDGIVRTFTLAEDGYIRFSHRQSETQPERLPTVYIKNLVELYPTIITVDNIADHTKSGTDLRALWRDQNRPKMRRPVVTLISDDLHQYNETWYVPLLDEYDVKSTFAVIGQRTQQADQGEENGYLPSSYVKQLYKDGHNIASHTWTHGRMNEMSLEDVEAELARTKLYLEQFVDVPVNMFISPFGIRSAAIDNLVSKYYDANFISGYGSLNPPPLDNYFLNRVSFDAAEADPQLRWDTVLKPAIDEAIAENNWTVFAVHPQYGQYRGAFGELRKGELRTLIEYCIANNVEIITADKAYNYWKNFVEIGVQRVDSRYYKLGMDGTEANVGYFEDVE